MPWFKALSRGDPAPWFKQRSPANPAFAFDVVAGRYLALCFIPSAAEPKAKAALDAAFAAPCFDDEHASFFAVTMDPADEAERRIDNRPPGRRVFWDFDGAVSKLYGALANDDAKAARRLWVLIDPRLRILNVLPLDGVAPEEVIAMVAALPKPHEREVFAPVLDLPNVFEPELCTRLIEYYRTTGNEESGFMREENGKTVLVNDYAHKRRRDCLVEDIDLIRQTQERVKRRIVPEILKAHQFKITRMERYLVGCYTADDGGHFRAHRDNTTKGTAHRRFAVTINLNSDYDGGELSFPEYGPRSYKPAPGEAVVFSCSLLHAASRVTRGERFAFLPFLYDDAAADLREQNNQHLADGLGEYRKEGG